jgi:hypothetical protein
VVVEQSRDVTGAKGVRLECPGTVLLSQGSESLVIRADEEIIEYIHAQVMGDLLRIWTDPGVSFNQVGPIEFHLSVPELRLAEIAGAGSVLADGFAVQDLVLRSTGAGYLEVLNIAGRSLEVSLSGAGNVTVSGSVDEQRFVGTGAGRYDARDLASDRAVVEINGAGSATVQVRNRLSVTVNGAGWVYYLGNPQVDSTINGAGGVQKID